MNKLMKLLKTLFPKPNLLQKRYVILVGIAIYWLLKAYVISTPDPSDDNLPDQLRGMVIDMYTHDNDN